MKRYTKEEFIDAVRTSYSYSEVCRKLGIVDRGGNINTIKKKIFLYKLDTSHFTGQLWNKGLTFIVQPKISHKNINDFLTKDSNHSTDSLKKRLLLEGIKEHRCECCNNTEWNKKPIPLELHHINGDRYDNRLENLMLLCPNCHAQTDNYGSKNKTKHPKIIYVSANTKDEDDPKDTRKRTPNGNGVCPVCGENFKKRNKEQIYCSMKCFRRSRWKNKNGITEDKLISAFIEFKSFLKVGKYFGLSDNAIRKWCTRYGVYKNDDKK